jgi:hypothetical protein
MDPTEPRRRFSWLWLTVGVVVVVAAVVVAMVLTSGHAGGGDRDAAAPTPTGKGQPGLGSPEAAAETFLAAAKSGDGDKLLDLACVGRPACVREHAAGMDAAQLAEAQDSIREGVYELGVHLEHATFTTAVDGDEPGVKKVPYRTPEMTGDAYLSLTFVKSDGD